MECLIFFGFLVGYVYLGFATCLAADAVDSWYGNGRSYNLNEDAMPAIGIFWPIALVFVILILPFLAWRRNTQLRIQHNNERQRQQIDDRIYESNMAAIDDWLLPALDAANRFDAEGGMRTKPSEQ